jgi:L-methionine (R)-S-oxide reductase
MATYFVMSFREEKYQEVCRRLEALLAGQTDEVACLATVCCELFHGFENFHWVGFYRVTSPRVLTVGPYQGGHGCLKISFDRGVCGAAARTKQVQIVGDVNAVVDHIACSTSTQSEIVLPIMDAAGDLRAVLDVDSDDLASFDDVDEVHLTKVCKLLTRACYSNEYPTSSRVKPSAGAQ